MSAPAGERLQDDPGMDAGRLAFLSVLVRKVEVHRESGGLMRLTCPIGNHALYIEPGANALGDSLWCDGPGSEECDPERAESALRLLASALPDRCPEVDRPSGYHRSSACPACLRWESAAKDFYRGLAADPATDEVRRACRHEPPCPSGMHHDRLEWREADRWALGVVEGEDDDGSGFAESSLAEAPALPEPRYFDLGDGNRIVRPGDLVYLHGMNAAGKSPTLDMLGREHLEADPDTLWVLLDYELGATRQRDRLLVAGFTKEQIEEAIYYVQFPPLLTDRSKEALVKGVLDKAERYGRVPRLFTWDTFARSCSRMPGADPEKNGHINSWFTSHPDWVKSTFEAITGEPVTEYIIDHPNKDDGPTPGGGHAKQDRVSINLWLRRDVPFSAGNEHGRSTFVVSKYAHAESRFTRGDEIARLRNRIGEDGVSRFYLESLLSEIDTSGNGIDLDLSKAGTDTDQKVMMSIIDALRVAREGGRSRTEITGGGSGASQRRAVLDQLVRDGMVVERPKPGTSTGKKYWLPSFAPS